MKKEKRKLLSHAIIGFIVALLFGWFILPIIVVHITVDHWKSLDRKKERLKAEKSEKPREMMISHRWMHPERTYKGGSLN